MRFSILLIMVSILILCAIGCGRPNENKTEDSTQIEYDHENNFDYQFNDKLNGIEIVKYKGVSYIVRIPKEINGKPVVGIADVNTGEEYDFSAGAFYGCDFVAEVHFPNGMVNIGDYAFSSCEGLNRVFIPDSVTSIGNGAFMSYQETIQKITYKGKTYITEKGWYYEPDIGNRPFYNMPKEFYSAVNK